MSLPFELEVGQLLLASCFAQVVGQPFVNVEMLLERCFACRGDKQRAANAVQLQLFNHVLHNRLGADRQHLLRLTLRGRKQPCTVTGDGNHRDINTHRRSFNNRGLAPRHRRGACPLQFDTMAQRIKGDDEFKTYNQRPSALISGFPSHFPERRCIEAKRDFMTAGRY